MDHVYAWCDSSAVLGWLNRSPSSLLVFVANRVGEVCSRIPADQWRYVATHQNPADYASRGLLPQELLQKDLWWNGPPWLSLCPKEWPRRPDINLDRELPDIKAVVLLVQPTEFPLWQRFSSHDKLLRTVAWCLRFIRQSDRTPYVGMQRIPPSRNTLHSQPYLAPEQTFSSQIQHRRSLGHLLHTVNTFHLRTYLRFKKIRKGHFHLDFHHKPYRKFR